MVALFITLLFIFLVAYYLNNKAIIAPAVLFSGGFLLAAFFALLNIKEWDIVIDKNTFSVLGGGVAVFVFACYIIKVILGNKSNVRENGVVAAGEQSSIKIKKNVTFIVCLVVIFNLLVIEYFVIKATGISNPLSAAGHIKSMASDSLGKITLPKLAAILSTINSGIGFAVEYLFVKVLIEEKKVSILLGLTMILCWLTALSSGSRGGVFTQLIALGIYFYFVLKDKKGWSSSNKKFLLFMLIGGGIILSLLQASASFVGRDVETFTPFEYTSIYLGAQIKNFSLFVQSGNFPMNIGLWGAETFYNFIPTVTKVFGISYSPYQLYLPFIFVDGKNLGNVYTTFYSWLLDFGYLGMWILLILMAVIAEVVYLFAMKNDKYEGMSISRVFYGYVGALVFLSFFSNRFYEAVATNLIYMIIVWFILKRSLVIKN